MKLWYNSIGSGQPLVILHGLFGMSDNWNTIGKALAEKFNVILVDLRNHGRSPHSSEWTYDVMCEDLYTLVEEVKSQKSKVRREQPGIILMGHSLGGKVAMQFASMHPELLEKLIVVDMAPKQYPANQFDFMEKLLQLDLSKFRSRKEIEVGLKEIISDNATVQLLIKNIKIPAGDNETAEWKFNLKVLAGDKGKIGQTFHLAEKIETPSLFIRGERSNYVTDDDIPEIRKTFVNADFQTIPGAGHWVHAEKPEEFVKAVLDYCG